MTTSALSFESAVLGRRNSAAKERFSSTVRSSCLRASQRLRSKSTSMRAPSSMQGRGDLHVCKLEAASRGGACWEGRRRACTVSSCGTKPTRSGWRSILSGTPLIYSFPETVPYLARPHSVFMKELLPQPDGPCAWRGGEMVRCPMEDALVVVLVLKWSQSDPCACVRARACVC